MENKSNSGVVYQGKIPGRVKYCFAFGALGKDLIYGMIATFSMIYFTDIIKVAPAFIGTMFFVAKLWDAFNDLFMGMIVDNTRSRWGKFVPWLVIGTLINSFVFSLQTLIVKFTAAFTALAIGFVLELTGYVPNTVQTLATQNSIRILMCIVPALGIILAYVVFKTKYKLNDEFMKKVISKITGSSTSSEQE